MPLPWLHQVDNSVPFLSYFCNILRPRDILASRLLPAALSMFFVAGTIPTSLVRDWYSFFLNIRRRGFWRSIRPSRYFYTCCFYSSLSLPLADRNRPLKLAYLPRLKAFSSCLSNLGWLVGSGKSQRNERQDSARTVCDARGCNRCCPVFAF